MGKRRQATAWAAGLALLNACVGSPSPAPPTIKVEAAGDGSRHSLAGQVWGLQPTDPVPALTPEELTTLRGAGRQDPQAPPQDPARPADPAVVEPPPVTGQGPGLSAEERASIRARFGSGVLIGAEGSVTKRYYLSGEAGRVLQSLLSEPDAPAQPGVSKQIGGGGSQSILARMLGAHAAELTYIANFERPDYIPIRNPVTGAAPPNTETLGNDLLLVKAEVEGLAAFEDALNLFFADVPQVEIEVKVVEYSTSDSLSFGVGLVGEDIPSSIKSVNSGALIKNITSQFPLSAPFFGGSSLTDRGIITLGGIHDNVELNAALELLATNNVADILSNPKLVVRNGGLATVSTTTSIPFPTAKITSSGQNVVTDIGFKDTGITLNIRPVIAGTQTVILQIYAQVAAVTGFAETDPVPTPIISTREVVSSVHVTNGKTTVIGGLVTDTTFESEQKIPILGDIPILGYLFRSSTTQQSRTTLEFHITPRVLQGQSGVSVAPIGG